MLFSVIIPVYNVENYLEECLNSVLKQTFKDFEIILINDGTKDSSGLICEKYNANYNNIIYLIQENSGLSATRNKGISIANGEYIIFIDSDDYLFYDNAFEEIADLLKQNNYPDIILHEESRIFPNGRILYENNAKYFLAVNDFQTNIKSLIENELFVASGWDKIVKKSILIDNKIYFPVGLKSEDMKWSSDLIPHINTFKVYDKSFLMYRQFREGSITNTVSERHLLDVYNMLVEGISSEKVNNSIYKDSLIAYWAEHYCFLLMNLNLFTKKSSEVIKHIKAMKYLLDTNGTKNVKKVNSFYKIFGLDFTIYALNKFRVINLFVKRYRKI